MPGIPCDSSLGISEIAIVGVDDNHAGAKTDFTVPLKCTANPKQAMSHPPNVEGPLDAGHWPG
jgi:hypothetical protein